METRTATVECKTFELLWLAARHQVRASETFPEKAGYYRLAFTILSFMTVEGYVNHLGEILFPDVWKKERSIFSSRGSEFAGSLGKIKYIASRVGMNITESDRPFITIIELKRIRDALAHARTERFDKTIQIAEGTLPDLVTPKIFEMLSEDIQKRAVIDVPEFIKNMNKQARTTFPDEPDIDDHVLTGMMVSQTA